ncbi:hypothetical protein NE237_003156 [Protea cynaroides]|uniref:Reverse transcriptase/retrotransposon-derived protein RNase H-like domain-containing protein n=1 Tax=Protea cynaroides TaxID=273540 RepID=A0A9Q0KGG0_9MAGN|nr:hypothetical protein NE237_003156 [Protea cynaroides]
MEHPFQLQTAARIFGLTGYYCRFIKNYASVEAPLTYLLKEATQHHRFTWNQQAQQAFESLKIAITEAPVFILPDFDQPFSIETGASVLGKPSYVDATMQELNLPMLGEVQAIGPEPPSLHLVTRGKKYFSKSSKEEFLVRIKVGVADHGVTKGPRHRRSQMARQVATKLGARLKERAEVTSSYSCPTPNMNPCGVQPSQLANVALRP